MEDFVKRQQCKSPLPGIAGTGSQLTPSELHAHFGKFGTHYMQPGWANDAGLLFSFLFLAPRSGHFSPPFTINSHH